jgi:hypothetical protein
LPSFYIKEYSKIGIFFDVTRIDTPMKKIPIAFIVFIVLAVFAGCKKNKNTTVTVTPDAADSISGTYTGYIRLVQHHQVFGIPPTETDIVTDTTYRVPLKTKSS